MTKTIVETKWIKKLPGCKTSADFKQAIAGLKTDRLAAQTLLEQFKADKDAALFAGNETIAIDRKIADVVQEITDIDAALSGAEKRAADAEKVEDRAQVDQWLADLEVLSAKGTEALQKKADFLELARGQAAIWDPIRTEIERLNAYLIAAGQPFKAQTNIKELMRLALEGRAGPLNHGLSEHGKPLDIHLRDLASNVRFLLQQVTLSFPTMWCLCH